MRIILTAIGTQGDIEFASLGSKNDAMLASDAYRIVMGGSGIKKIFAFIKLVKLAQIHKVPLEKEFKLYELVKKENPDRIVYQFKNV